MVMGKRPPLDEWLSLFRATIAREGITTGAGAATGDSIIDAALIGIGANSFVSMLMVVYPGEPANVDSMDITAFNNATGEITLSRAYKGVAAAIPIGVPYKIVTFRFVPAEVAALTTMVETDQYYDRIFYDEDTGIAGTAWPVGTPQVPSDVIADIITICAARNLRTIQVHGALTLGAAMEHYNFVGYDHEDIADTLDLNGHDVDGSHISNLFVTGAQGGTGFLTLVRCVAYALTLFAGRMEDTDFYGSAFSLRDADYADIDDCHSIHSDVTITVQAPTRASIKNWEGNLILTAQDGGVCYVRGLKGDLTIDAMTLGSLDIFMNSGRVTINANCTGGTINIFGSAVVTDNSIGAVVNDYTLDQRAANIDTQLDGMLVQVPFYNQIDTIVNDEVILFEFDALGATIREIFIGFYLPLHVGATFTPTWRKTRPNDLVTFTTEVLPALATIITPAANAYYSFKLGELAQGLQGRFYLAQDNIAGVRTVDAWAVALMVL